MLGTQERGASRPLRIRHARACRGHPHLCGATANEDVDGRHKAGHDARRVCDCASVVRHAAGELRTDRLEAVEDIEAARELVRVDVVLAHDPHADAVGTQRTSQRRKLCVGSSSCWICRLAGVQCFRPSQRSNDVRFYLRQSRRRVTIAQHPVV